MMKKISKLALLAAATAFLLAGFPACSGEEDDGGIVPTTDTVSPASFELTSGAEEVTKDFTLTLVTTQINETGLAELKAGDLTSQIDTIVSQSGSDITVSALKVAEDATATTLKLSVTMASNAPVGTKGTITLTLPAGFTANGTAIAKTLSYTITDGTTTPDEGDSDTPTAKPFVWNASDWFETYPKDSPALTEDTKFGELTIGAKNKVTNDGTFDITVGEETVTVAGYFQLNNSSKGSVTFYAPKDTTKISIWAKLDNANKQLKFSAGETELHTFTGESGTNYKEYSFEPSFTADTTVTITNPGSSSANCKYLVVAAPTSPETIPVTKITISTADTVRVGGRIALTASVEPENATKQTVDWSLPEGETNATISGGKLLGVGAGTVTVTASAKDESGVTATKDITITAAATASVTDEDLGLTAAEVSGSDTVATGAKTDTGVTFTAVAPGEATATVKDASGNTATVTVTVAEDGAVTAEVKEAYSENGATVKYHVYKATASAGSADSAPAENSNEAMLKGTDAGFVAYDGDSSATVIKTGAVKANTSLTGGYGIEYTTASKAPAAGEVIESYTFAVKAVEACTISEISWESLTSSATGSLSLYLDDETTPAATVSDKKNFYGNDTLKTTALQKTLAKDAELKVTVKWTAKDATTEDKAKTFKMTVGQVVIKASAAE